MLEDIDLKKKFSKEEYKSIMPALQVRISELQRMAKEKAVDRRQNKGPYSHNEKIEIAFYFW